MSHTLSGRELGRLEHLARNGDHDAQEALQLHHAEITKRNLAKRHEEQTRPAQPFGKAGLDEARRRFGE